MAEKVFEIEYHPGEEVVLHFKAPILSVVPEATGHFRTAHKELLLALRSLLDKAIERAEEAEKTKAEERTKIEVE
ncbi:MAG: hypothetical protein E3J28_01220 [Desulfobacteraceae bacterium]|nr:MAG: hypothetical protein E3J28_01220 [Desulfobacteraceae bacterium]